jgi:hypothetical protein
MDPIFFFLFEWHANIFITRRHLHHEIQIERILFFSINFMFYFLFFWMEKGDRGLLQLVVRPNCNQFNCVI